jgi:hypothetical protein
MCCVVFACVQHHEDGVVSVTFKTPEEGDVCVAAMQGRWFAKRQIIAATYDGKTKYEVKETDAEREERLKGWEKFLKTDDKNKKATAEATATSAQGQVSANSAGESNTLAPAGQNAEAAGAASAEVPPLEPLPHRTEQPQVSDTPAEGAAD